MSERRAPALSAAQVDRACGVLLGQACGDALGVPYEFARLPPPGQPARMAGGGLGPYAPGEYSDDTQMAVCIARVAAAGADLTSEEALDVVAEGFLEWLSAGATDVGAQIRGVLAAAAREPGGAAKRLRSVARELHERTGMTAGNGALMRTAPVALAHLGEPEEMAAAARAVAELTHADPLAGDACVLWCAGIDHAVYDGAATGVRSGLELLPAARRDRWAGWLTEAEQSHPGRFNPNGFTVPALQAAYSAVVCTPVPRHQPAAGRFPCLHLRDGLQSAVRAGDDTDTVAAIAGALLGARWGVSAVPSEWTRVVHGWPEQRARHLVRLAYLAVQHGQCDVSGWPLQERANYGAPPQPVVAHPADDGVLLGNASTPTDGVDAVVSLCRLGTHDVPAAGVEANDHVEVWLIDTPHPEGNAHVEFVIDDAARVVARLRDEGKRVLVHCVMAQSRTPTIAARYATLRGVAPDEAMRMVTAALPAAMPNDGFVTALRHLAGEGDTGRRR